MQNKTVRIAVFASSNASDFPAIMSSIKSGVLKGKCEIVVAIVNHDFIGAISKFHDNNIETHIVKTKNEDRDNVYSRIDAILESKNIDLVICVGWMHIISKNFVRKWNKNILNIHPSLLPKFPGAHAIKDALEAGEKISGCTVHYIDEGVDTGEIIMKRELKVESGETIESLKSKIQILEQEIYPLAILEVIS